VQEGFHVCAAQGGRHLAAVRTATQGLREPDQTPDVVADVQADTAAPPGPDPAAGQVVGGPPFRDLA
jgi:hypothetical protein